MLHKLPQDPIRDTNNKCQSVKKCLEMSENAGFTVNEVNKCKNIQSKYKNSQSHSDFLVASANGGS